MTGPDHEAGDDQAARILHDLNNELAVIGTATELAAGVAKPDAEVRAHLDRIRGAVEAAAALVRELRGDTPTAPAEREADGPSAATGTGGRVLVVDDSETMRRLIAYALERGGFEVSVAAGGDEALASIGSPLEPDLLLVDVQMPGMSGQELAARARRMKPRLPLLFVTGEPTDAVEFDGGTAPAVRKPFVASELLRHVESALGR